MKKSIFLLLAFCAVCFPLRTAGPGEQVRDEEFIRQAKESFEKAEALVVRGDDLFEAAICYEDALLSGELGGAGRKMLASIADKLRSLYEEIADRERRRSIIELGKEEGISEEKMKILADRIMALGSMSDYRRKIELNGKKAFDLDPSQYGYLLGQAKQLSSTGYYEEAAALMDRIIEKNPDDLFLKYEKAGILHEKGDIKGAVKCYDEIRSKGLPIEEARKIFMARAYFENGQYDVCRSMFEDIWAKGGVKEMSAVLSLCEIYAAEKKWDGLAEFAEKNREGMKGLQGVFSESALKEFGYSLDYYKGVALYGKGDGKRALEILEPLYDELSPVRGFQPDERYHEIVAELRREQIRASFPADKGESRQSLFEKLTARGDEYSAREKRRAAAYYEEAFRLGGESGVEKKKLAELAEKIKMTYLSFYRTDSVTLKEKIEYYSKAAENLRKDAK